MIIYKRFRFEAAHFLAELPPHHKCAHLHGHSWEAIVSVSGRLALNHWLMDFGKMKHEVEPLIKLFDHQSLNDEPLFDGMPTSEAVARFFFWFLRPQLPVERVEICETCTSGAVYDLEDYISDENYLAAGNPGMLRSLRSLREHVTETLSRRASIFLGMIAPEGK